jgi:hypothetical protein
MQTYYLNISLLHLDLFYYSEKGPAEPAHATPNITPPFFEQLVLELQHGHLEDNSTRCKPIT